jgi:hypothetical protein
MLLKLIPILLLCVGVASGIGAGLALRPEPEPIITEGASEQSDEAKTKESQHDAEKEKEYVKLNNQFIVPVVRKTLIESLVVLSLSIEVEAGQADLVYSHEPKLRDVLLQVLFDHANIGGFGGAFTNSNTMDILRISLTEAAQAVLGKAVSGVLITDIARQDV